MEETINLLLEEINSNLKEMKGLSKSSDEYGNIVSDTGKLLDKVTPMIKIKDEADERAKNRKEDLDIQEKIRKNALVIYKHKLEKGNSTGLAKRCNDFTLLEELCKDYK